MKLKNIPETAFVVFFQGFFFYHALASIGVIVPVAALGGYSGMVGVVLLPILMLIYVLRINNRKILINRIDKLFLGLMIYIFIVAILNYSLGQGLIYEGEMWIASLTALMYNLLLYLMGRLIQFEKNNFKFVLVISVVAMTIFALVNLNSYGYFNPASMDENLENIASYQGLARSLVITSIVCIAIMEKKFNFVVFSISSATGMAALGSRSEFVSFLITVLIIAILKHKVRSFLFVAVSTIIVAFLGTLVLPESFFHNDRIFEISNVFKSESGLARTELTNDAIATIKNNMILGNYGSYAEKLNIGSYAHNILSAWVDLGFIGFVWYLISFLFMGVALFRKKYEIKKILIYWVALSVYSVTFLLMFVAKEYQFMFFGFAAGVTSALAQNEKMR